MNKKLIYHNKKNGTAEVEVTLGRTILYIYLDNVHKKPHVTNVIRKVKPKVY